MTHSTFKIHLAEARLNIIEAIFSVVQFTTVVLFLGFCSPSLMCRRALLRGQRNITRIIHITRNENERQKNKKRTESEENWSETQPGADIFKRLDRRCLEIGKTTRWWNIRWWKRINSVNKSLHGELAQQQGGGSAFTHLLSNSMLRHRRHRLLRRHD